MILRVLAILVLKPASSVAVRGHTRSLVHVAQLTRVFTHSDHTLCAALHCMLSQHMDHADAWRRKACRASHRR